MDWSKTKTIFIIVFLILDVFLLNQYIGKKTATQYEVLAESSFEDNLKENDISYKTLPKDKGEDQYISTKRKVFTKEDFKKTKFPKQINISEDGKTVTVTLDSPVSVGEKNHSEAANTFVKDNVLYGDHYKYFGADKDRNSLVYYQTYKGKMFAKNYFAKLELFLDANNEIVSYQQTYLDDIEPNEGKEELQTALKAIEVLFRNGNIPAKSKITDVELVYCYYLDNSSIIFVPSWRVELNKKDNLFVTAFDGEILSSESMIKQEKETGIEP
ncbi:two-component system regulatory protein YycI [Bacillus testis]|uniref:two-component system regulatory protein YycI n=1 Tax=Bacillus testis TaxID=1622072 RepID=UPI00067EEB66|nr:two-component system regulatory protein YycI [Bacillus testis]